MSSFLFWTCLINAVTTVGLVYVTYGARLARVKRGEVTSAMVLAACDAYTKSINRKSVNGSYVEDMRAALEAAIIAPHRKNTVHPRSVRNDIVIGQGAGTHKLDAIDLLNAIDGRRPNKPLPSKPGRL